jgi:hypothetical protein
MLSPTRAILILAGEPTRRGERGGSRREGRRQRVVAGEAELFSEKVARWRALGLGQLLNSHTLS